MVSETNGTIFFICLQVTSYTLPALSTKGNGELQPKQRVQQDGANAFDWFRTLIDVKCSSMRLQWRETKHWRILHSENLAGLTRPPAWGNSADQAIYKGRPGDGQTA